MTNSKESLETDAKALGERLALLLAAANLPEEIKASFVAMIPDMTLEQLDRFMKILEQNVQNVAASEETNLIQSIQQVQKDYEQQRQEAEAQAMKELEEIGSDFTNIE